MISNVFYISAKRLQKLNGNDALQNSLPMHSSTDQRLTESPLVKISLINFFRDHFFSPKILCTSLSTHNVAKEKGWMWKAMMRGYGNSPKSFVHTAHCLWSLQFVKCDCTGYFGISYLLQRHLKKDRDICEPALEAGQAWAEKRKKHYLITVWNITLSWPRFHWTPPSSSLTFGSSSWEGRIMTQLLMTALWLQLAEEKN